MLLRPMLTGILPAALMACAHAGARVPSRTDEGLFEYRATVGSTEFKGVVTVVADSVTLEPRDGFCRRDFDYRGDQYARYECDVGGGPDKLYLNIDKRSPALHSSWTALVQVQRSRRICVQYEVRNGQRVCVQTQLQYYYQTVRQGGRMQLWNTTSPG
jgi:hypothetical protein